MSITRVSPEKGIFTAERAAVASLSPAHNSHPTNNPNLHLHPKYLPEFSITLRSLDFKAQNQPRHHSACRRTTGEWLKLLPQGPCTQCLSLGWVTSPTSQPTPPCPPAPPSRAEFQHANKEKPDGHFCIENIYFTTVVSDNLAIFILVYIRTYKTQITMLKQKIILSAVAAGMYRSSVVSSVTIHKVQTATSTYRQLKVWSFSNITK